MALTKWDFDLAHSSVNFHVRHLMVSKVHGRFTSWSGVLELDDQDLTKSRVEVSIDVASVDTKDDKRDDHLRSADFFDAANHPKITFKSKRVERDGDDYRVTGDLTIRGTTKEIVLAVEGGGEHVKDPWGGVRTGFSAKAAVDRKEFGLMWNVALEAGGFLVGDKVEITLEIEAIKASADKAA